MNAGAPEHPAYGRVRAVTASASVILARNPGRMTLEGTNTWILRAPGHQSCVVVDPGPRSRAHLDLVAAQGPVELVLITHRHGDHTAGIRGIVSRTGAPVRAVGEKYVRASTPLVDDEVIDAAGMRMQVVHTPGHTADSICVVLDDAVITGDTILGHGTSVLDGRDGSLGSYLRSLERLIEVGVGRTALPGHGCELPDTAAAATAYRTHRLDRLEQVRSALAELGPRASASAVVRRVYADIDITLWPAARQSVKAQLAYLRS